MDLQMRKEKLIGEHNNLVNEKREAEAQAQEYDKQINRTLGKIEFIQELQAEAAKAEVEADREADSPRE